MECEAPGSEAREALHRDKLRKLRVPASCAGRYPRIPQKEASLMDLPHLSGNSTYTWCNFTLQLSDIRVGNGRLGEVVSLVGDCRPPPPGNPHRPTGEARWRDPGLRPRINSAQSLPREFCFSSKIVNNGGLNLSFRSCSSLIGSNNTGNLKKLNHHQYFKINRSYYSCTRKKRVLEFERLRSHLCGFRRVTPPPMAITNVLETG
jgi:hypothetical protein